MIVFWIFGKGLWGNLLVEIRLFFYGDGANLWGK